MHPYVIGFIAADGNVQSNHWTISQNEDGVDVLDKILKTQKYGRIIKIKNKDGYRSTKQRYCLYCLNKNSNSQSINKQIKELIDWGMCIGKKTYKLTFPLNKKEKDIWTYLRGYFDGDGCIGVSNGLSKMLRIQIISNHKWCIACSEFLKKYGIKSFVTKDKRHPGISQVVVCNRNDVHKYMGLMYKDKKKLFMKRKYEKWMTFKKVMPCIFLMSKSKKKLNEKELKYVQQCIAKGIYVTKISKKLDCNPSTIRDFLRNKRGNNTALYKRQKKQVLKYLKKGYSGYAIRRKTGIHSRVIYDVIKKEGRGYYERYGV